MSQRVTHEVNPASVPGDAEHFRYRSLDALMRIGNDEARRRAGLVGSAYALFSTSERRFIMTSVIGGIPQAGPRNPTRPEITDRQIQRHHSTGHDLKKMGQVNSSVARRN